MEDLLTKLHQTPLKVLKLQEIFSHNAKEYVGTAVTAWCRRYHIAHTLSSPYYHYHDGLAESPGFFIFWTPHVLSILWTQYVLL